MEVSGRRAAMRRVDRRSLARAVGAAAALAAAAVLAGCSSAPASGGTAPPVPSGPAGRPSSSATPSFPDITPSQALPTPTGYPGLRVAGVDGCALLTPAARQALGLTVSEGIDGADGSCDFDDDTGTVDVFLFLRTDRTLSAWAAEQADYTSWQTLTDGSTTGVMATGGPQCNGVFAVAENATIEALVNAEDGDTPCARATDVLTAALAGLRLAQ